MFIQSSGLINDKCLLKCGSWCSEMDRPHFVQILEMPFDLSANANVMRICSGVKISIKHVQ